MSIDSLHYWHLLLLLVRLQKSFPFPFTSFTSFNFNWALTFLVDGFLIDGFLYLSTSCWSYAESRYTLSTQPNQAKTKQTEKPHVAQVFRLFFFLSAENTLTIDLLGKLEQLWGYSCNGTSLVAACNSGQNLLTCICFLVRHIFLLFYFLLYCRVKSIAFSCPLHVSNCNMCLSKLCTVFLKDVFNYWKCICNYKT